ncbi:MAG: hypothetical protein ACYDEC_01925 [Bacteroidia bacterium]
MRKNTNNNLLQSRSMLLKSFVLLFLLLLNINSRGQINNLLKAKDSPKVEQVPKNIQDKVISINALIVDSITKYGAYKIIFTNEFKAKNSKIIIYVDDVFYKTIGGKNRKVYNKLKKYLQEKELDQIITFFDERYPPKI